MLFEQPLPDQGPLRAAIRSAYRMDETACVEQRLHQALVAPEAQQRIQARARELVEAVRAKGPPSGGIDAFMHEYQLSSREGVVLMCLAEALLRVPDADTADRLISDKLGAANWAAHLGGSDSAFVNASTWALMLTGRVLSLHEGGEGDWRRVMKRLVSRSGEPLIRQAVRQAMRILGRQFVTGRTIEEALSRATEAEQHGYSYSYDMLGEAACTRDDAERYFHDYCHAIEAIGGAASMRGPVAEAGISVKLSALHPRYEFAKRLRLAGELVPRLRELCLLAMQAGIGLTVDAEEADRLEPSLDVIEAVSGDAALSGWQGLGVALQAYQQRAMPVIDWLQDLAERHQRRLMVRLVKGAYWDTEIKASQVAGLAGYPVFTRKASTDVSFLACARRLLAAPEAFFPAFATHNAHTIAAVQEMAGDREFEFQRLHGMGEELYRQVREQGRPACRIYAPVGSHQELLAYLVRRLLENGANTSFVNRMVERGMPVEDLIADPLAETARLQTKPHPRIPLPVDLYGSQRRNSRGTDLSDLDTLLPLTARMELADQQRWRAQPLVDGVAISGPGHDICNPADTTRVVGECVEADAALVARGMSVAVRAQPGWDAQPASARAEILERCADLYQRHAAELMALAIREAGKTLMDAVAELREAVDFLRYYALQARAGFAGPQLLQGPTGERNELSLHGRGVFVCISPWNFPLAIFTGQVAAALAAGNAVLAKPAEQTPLIACRAVQLMHRAGVPGGVLQLLPGSGSKVGAALTAHPEIAGVAFTGSTETARLINRALAARDAPIVPLIAETGGQNAMLVDSTALPEQVVRDVLASAFQSAGQRCSALRVLFVQDDVAERTVRMLAGAMAELSVGDPALLATDVGPVIDEQALQMLQAHAARMDREARSIFTVPLPENCRAGRFFAPRAYEIEDIGMLEREIFGPVLHIVRYPASGLDAVLDAINATGYGLTLGVHSRIDATVDYIHARVRVGNTYVNRNQIGAVVGVQPFGGEGLSGTGPKAGGPQYLHRFATERSLSVDTTAAGGNAALMAMSDR